MKRIFRVVASTLCAAIVMGSGVFAQNLDVNAAGLAIDKTNFPDVAFRKYISEQIDKDGNGQLSQSEMDAVSSIYIDPYNWENWEIVSDLTGIGNFTNLSELNCSWNELKSLDLSENVNLVDLYCQNNLLTSLDLSKNTKLAVLYCSSNQLTSLDLSKNVNLVEVICHLNQLTNLNVGKNTNLKYLCCPSNYLTSLDLSANINLERVECEDNELSSINLGTNTKLNYLSCFSNKLKNLNVSKNTNLDKLYCSTNLLTSLDISKCVKLTELSCNENLLTSLDVSHNPNLKCLTCYDTSIASLDITNNDSLYKLCKTQEMEYSYTYEDYLNNDYSKPICIGCLIQEKEEIDEYTATYTTVEIISIDINTTLTGKGEVLYAPANASPTPTTEPTATPEATPTANPTVAPTTAPTSAPTVGPIPTAAPTAEASKSVGSFVDRCYSVALGREADEGGYNYWLDALNNGEICGAQAGYGFIFSGEYANKETTNDEFVTDLYSMYFGRTPDEGGFNYWVGLLNSGASREEIFAGFANSTEFDNLCSDYGVVTGAYIVGVPNDQQGGVNAFVARLYNICLNRRPDMAGQSGWAQKLIAGEVTGTTCAYGFVFSPEFIGKEPSNEDFVAYMYRAFFGREADEAGFTAWVSTLNDGGSYEDVFNGFTGSLEFANLCASYGIQA